MVGMHACIHPADEWERAKDERSVAPCARPAAEMANHREACLYGWVLGVFEVPVECMTFFQGATPLNSTFICPHLAATFQVSKLPRSLARALKKNQLVVNLLPFLANLDPFQKKKKLSA